MKSLNAYIVENDDFLKYFTKCLQIHSLWRDKATDFWEQARI